MFEVSAVIPRRIFVLVCIAALSACGGGGGGGDSRVSDQNNVTDQSNLSAASGNTYEITGAGIKGPLAYATVSIYALDTSFDELYNPNAPVSTATTNAYAEISGLSVSRDAPPDSAPPYVLVVDGTDAIDRNTGTAPVIKKLVTILTSKALDSGQPVYATPYTTLAYEMLRLDTPRTGGNGLQARYYNDMTFSNLALERVDASVNFSWDYASPNYAVNQNQFSVRWTGFVEPDISDTYTFYTSTDDGVRLWVDGQLIVDHWQNQGETEYTGTIQLEAGTRYPVVMEYYDDQGGAVAKLSWSDASQVKTIVPKRNLFTDGAGAGRGTDPLLASKLSTHSEEINQVLGFGMPAVIDIFTSAPILTENTVSIAQQQQVVYHRAAIEALAAVVNEISLASDPHITTDAIIQKLALDVYSDGVLDTAENGSPISGINIDILAQNPMMLDIPNTDYLISETPALILEEKALVGASADVTFYIDDVDFALGPLAINAAPAVPAPTPAAEDNSNPPVDNSNPPANTIDNTLDYLLYADFNNRPVGAYAENAIRADFQVNMHGRNHPNWYVQDMDIAVDPDSSGRGNVLRVKRYANRGWSGPGNGGMAFRADFAAREDVYFAFDMYLAPDHEFMLNQKNPGLASGAHSDLHPDINTYPTPEALENFVHVITAEGQDAWGRGDGALSTYFYDKDGIGGNEFWDKADPTFAIGSNTAIGGAQYHQPRGRWITVEVRVKMNTVTVESVSGLKDGLQEVWVTDPLLWEGAKKVSSHNHRWRITNSIVTDGIEMALGYGGDGDDPGNQPSKDQYHYYDNFRVATKPITH